MDRFRKGKFPNAALSVGNLLQQFSNTRCVWEAVGPARAAFDKLDIEIRSHLKKFCEDFDGEVGFTVCMVGRDRDSASPTVVFISLQEATRKRVRKEVESSGILKKYSTFKVMDCNRPPGFADMSSLAKAGNESHIIGTGHEKIWLKNLHGARIFFYDSNTTNNVEVKMAASGAVLCRKQEHFIITVGHVFPGHIQPKNAFPQNVGRSKLQYNLDDWSDNEEIDDATVEEMSKASSSSTNSDPEDTKMFDRFGFLTLPDTAMYDIPSQEQVFLPVTDVEQLSMSLANDFVVIQYLDASTIHLPLPVIGGNVRLLDYALLPISPFELESFVHHLKDIETNFNYGNLCLLVEAALEKGDSGSCVWDDITGEIYGHLIAGSPSTRFAYVLPMTDVLEDLDQYHGDSWKVLQEIFIPVSPQPLRIVTDIKADIAHLENTFKMLELNLETAEDAKPPRPDEVARIKLKLSQKQKEYNLAIIKLKMAEIDIEEKSKRPDKAKVDRLNAELRDLGGPIGHEESKSMFENEDKTAAESSTTTKPSESIFGSSKTTGTSTTAKSHRASKKQN